MRILSLFLTLMLSSAGHMAPAQGVKKQPALAERSGPLTDEEFNNRRLLRLNQLWNMYRVRNDQFFSEAHKAELQKVMNTTRVPELKNSEALDLVSAKIRASASALNRALKAEQKLNRYADVNATNLDYLNNTLLPKLEDRAYFQGTRKEFEREFKKMVPASYSPNIQLHSPNGLPIPLTPEQRAAAEAAEAASAAASAAAPTVVPPTELPAQNIESVKPGPGTYYVPAQNANTPYVPVAPNAAVPQSRPASTNPKPIRIIMEPEGTQ